MSESMQLDLFDNDVRDKDISSIDRLFHDIKRYRKCSEFKKKLEFYANFPNLGVYNAALVEQQRPGARLVLTAENWKDMYGRIIKPNARPVIILMPFYPVDFLFDISDTKPIDNSRKEDRDMVIERIIHQFKATSTQDTSFYMRNVKANLPKHGIYYNSHYIVGSEMQAEIRRDQSETLEVKYYKDKTIKYHNYFTISVNFKAEEPEQLASIFHELGHLFCQHIVHPWCKDRSYTHEVKEFEAETVSYLVCERLGIKTHSTEYLALYLEDNDKIPEISLECVFQAVDLIERIATGYMNVSDCLLYKKDPIFKEMVMKEKAHAKDEEARAKSVRPTP